LNNNVPITQHGRLLDDAVTWNLNNLVRGPFGNERANEPRSAIDTELLLAQPADVQATVRPFVNNDPANPPTFDGFTHLLPATPVDWSRRLEDNNYVVQQVEHGNKLVFLMIYTHGFLR
jgi:hypothetical protein